ncbi:MAG: RdgB/HAM1 family non-canonical purine NTP pyrophosphatase [Eubacteriales bacterium]|nr:RdgB/HAM1 family non-canonical purine NTP pyrophosphatase [Eubacteriales bacterium]
MMQIILATANEDKVREIEEIIGRRDLHLVSMRQAGFTDDIEENGDSFAANALIKARAVHQITGGYVLADDSGLAIDPLDGAPGIYSARFAGIDADYPTKINKLHDLLAPFPPETWTARFICVMALILPDGRSELFEGICRGRIAQSARGRNGFGYDPVFLLPERGQTMAELDPAEKHAISHRGRALKKLTDWLSGLTPE